MNISIVCWDEYKNDDKDSFEENCKRYFEKGYPNYRWFEIPDCIATVNHEKEHQEGCDTNKCCIFEDVSLKTIESILDSECVKNLTIIIHHTVKEPDQVKKKIESILALKAFW